MRFGGFRSSPIRTTPFRGFSHRPGGFHGRPNPSGPRFIPRIHFRRSRFSSAFGFPTTFFYAFPPYYYPSLGDDWENDGWSDQIPAAAAEPEQPQQDDALVNQVQALTEEVESLHEQQASGQSASRAPAVSQAGFEEKSVPAVFVYHDGHQLEAQNYAIMGQTLWVFGDEMTRKVPLAELDLAQTRKLNDERGIDFTPPELR